MTEGYETGSVLRLRGDLAHAKDTLLKYGRQLTSVAGKVEFLSDKLGVTSKLIKTKLQDEHIPFDDSGAKHLTAVCVYPTIRVFFGRVYVSFYVCERLILRM